MTPRKTTRLTDAEWIVMEAIWAAPTATAREVLERVHDATGWSYSTVKTQLTRLVEKGVLRETMEGNTAVYTSLLSRADARRTALRSLLDAAFGGRVGTLVQHLADSEKLSTRDREALRALLDEPESRA
ncbi:MAG: BlaI/MecI/CopY family transcriptional regulator [Planctomycetota bacterium]